MSATTTDTAAPSVPTGLVATVAGQTQINLTWNASTDNVGVADYRIYRGGTLLTQTTNLCYSDSGLSSSTVYSYTVAAYDAAGNLSAQSAVATATTQSTIPTSLFGLHYHQTAPSIPFGAMRIWMSMERLGRISTPLAAFTIGPPWMRG